MNFRFSTKQNNNGNVWVYRLKKREGIKIEKIEDLKDYKISVWRNDFRHLFLEQTLGNKNLYLTNNDKSAILMVRDGRADVFYFLRDYFFDIQEKNEYQPRPI